MSSDILRINSYIYTIIDILNSLHWKVSELKLVLHLYFLSLLQYLFQIKGLEKFHY